MEVVDKPVYDGFYIFHIGLDSFDSPLGGCTTHAATFLLHALNSRIPIKLIDYPNLVRLNPSIPWKTRGNGAVALRIAVPRSEAEVSELPSLVESLLAVYVEQAIGSADGALGGHEPGVLITIHPPPEFLGKLYELSLTDVVPSVVVNDFINRARGVWVSKLFSGRGIVGAAAAIGWWYSRHDYTFELLVYRSKRYYGKPRCVDDGSVEMFDKLYGDLTFNNVDRDTGRVLIKPKGRDPVLYGIRGATVDALLKSLEIIKVCEPIVAWTIFRSNQGTGAHAVAKSVIDLKPYKTGALRVVITSPPRILRGGTVVIEAVDSTGMITLAFFRPSKLAEAARGLKVGDYVEVEGHAKPWGAHTVFHVEKLVVLSLTRDVLCRNPPCPRCGKRLERAGSMRGYRCTGCGYEVMNVALPCIPLERRLGVRMYLPPPRAQKHLTKPIERYGREVCESFTPILMDVEFASRITEPLEFL